MDNNKQAMDILLEVIKAPLNGSGNAVKSKKSSKSSGQFALTRPLICICNDQYAPALRELKKIAKIFVFSFPQDARLVQRLKHICIAEGIEVPPSTVLNDLVSMTAHDIRSSINNLQFAALRMKKSSSSSSSRSSSSAVNKHHPGSTDTAQDLTAVIESMMGAGLKDDHLDSFQVWQRIFSSLKSRQSPAMKSSVSSSGATTRSDKEPTGPIMSAISSMLDHGDLEHLIQGIHENLHRVHALDNSTFNHHCVSADWLSYADLMSSFAMTQGSSDGFQVLPYVALVGGAVHHCHAANHRVKLDWPKKVPILSSFLCRMPLTPVNKPL